MLTCYLDDSGKDPQNLVTTLAGYVGRDTQWEAFERDVRPWFEEFKVKILHAKELQAGDGCFRGWTVLRKQAFVARICQARNANVMMGLSIGVLKSEYQKQRIARGRQETSSAYAFCFNVIVDWILRDIRLGQAAHTEGVTFVVEAGHENNGDAARAFEEIKGKYNLSDVLHSITFSQKCASKAIQLADLIAFYSRRDNERLMRATMEGGAEYEAEIMSRIIIEGIPHRGFVATEFGEGASGSRFLAGDP